MKTRTCFPLLFILWKEVSSGVCQLHDLEKNDKCSKDNSLTFKYKDDPPLDDDRKKKEKIETKVMTEEDKSGKNIEEGRGEESMGRRHWSHFNYRSTTFNLLITSDFDFNLNFKQVFRKDKKGSKTTRTSMQLHICSTKIYPKDSRIWFICQKYQFSWILLSDVSIFPGPTWTRIYLKQVSHLPRILPVSRWDKTTNRISIL